MNTTSGYLIRSGDSWTVMVRGEPRATVPTLRDALAIAQSIFGRVTISCWNADLAEFDSEFLTDPNY